ncbi:MAG: TonB-dependent receptor [Acidobacteriota bacterium]|nr:TonB-dependent receptor [Blastocatellia bacterium]MDW8413793.1 TonB-dependent receptor [Acidobacteriota bacterium]
MVRVFFVLFLFSVLAHSQTSGTLTGVVVDDQGRPLAGALVVAINENNGLPRNTITNEQGRYRISFLEPGRYTVRASLDGYITNEQTDQIIPLNQVTTLEVPPIVLRPVGTAQTPSAPTVQTFKSYLNIASAARVANFDSRLLRTLPLAGIRTFDAFALLVPGVLPPIDTGGAAGPGLGPGVGTSGQFSVNGHQGRANNFAIDGSDNNDQDVGVRRQGFVSLVPQSIESLNEFQIATSVWDTEFGRNIGSQVNAVSLSGGNEHHGTFYGFFNGRGLNARNFFDLTGGPSGSEDDYTRTQVGFVLGGPVVKNQTHYFASYENQYIDGTQETHFAVPTPRERSFNRSGFTTLIGRSLFAILPLPNQTGGPYGENNLTRTLPVEGRGNVFSIKITHKTFAESQFTARYNFTDDSSVIPTVGRAINASLGTDTRTQNLSLFLDSKITDTSFNQVRFSYGRTRLGFKEQPGSPFLFGEPRELQNLTRLAEQLRQAQVFRPEIYLEPINTNFGTYGPFGRTGPIGQLLVNPFSPVGIDPFTFPQGRTNNTFQLADTYAQTFGNHSIKFGVDFRRNQLNSFLDRNFRPQLIFNGGLFINLNQGIQPIFGSDVVSVGVPSQLFQTLALTPDSTIGLRFNEYNFFIQDNWKLRPRITFDYGLRYEYSSVPVEVNRRIERTFRPEFPAPDPQLNSLVPPAQVEAFLGVLRNATAALQRFLDGRNKIYRPDRNNFSPRVGLAIDISPGERGRTVLRLGYGVYYDQVIGSVTSQSRNVFPSFIPAVFDTLFAADPFNFVVRFPGSFLDAQLRRRGIEQNIVVPRTLNTLGFTPGFLQYELGNLLAFLQNGIQVDGQVFGGAGGLAFVLPEANFRSPYSQQWSVSLEHQIGNSYIVGLGYVGSTNTKLIRFRTPNGGPNSFSVIAADSASPSGLASRPFAPRRPFANLGPFTIISSSAASNYHSLQLSFEKKPSSDGLTLGSSYTYSHNIDEVSEVFDTPGNFSLPQDDFNLRAERASSGLDIRHRSVTYFVYELPLFKSNKYLSGFQLSGILTLQTGQPFTVNLNYDANRDGNTTDRIATDGVIKQVNRSLVRLEVPQLSRRELFLRLTPAFGLVGANGAVGRNTFRSPGIASMDFVVIKNFKFNERHNLIFRAEMFNLFNRVHFATPVRIVEAPGFGRSVYTSLPARLIQLAVKYSF